MNKLSYAIGVLGLCTTIFTSDLNVSARDIPLVLNDIKPRIWEVVKNEDGGYVYYDDTEGTEPNPFDLSDNNN